MVEEFGNTAEQTTSRATIEHAVIKTQGEARHGHWNKLLFVFVPLRLDAARTESEENGLLG